MCDFVFVLGKLREDNTKRVKKKRTKALVDNITRGTLSVTVPTVLMCVLSHIWPLATPWTAACRLLCPWDFLGKNTGADWDFLLQGIFTTQGSNLCLLHWQADSLPLSQQASSPMITQRHFLPLTSPSLYLRVIKHLRKMICGTFHNKFLFFAHFNIATFIFLSL